MDVTTVRPRLISVRRHGDVATMMLVNDENSGRAGVA